MTAPSIESRNARGAVFALFFTNGALFANVIPRYPEIKDTFELSDPAYGATIALFPLGAIIAGPLAAWFIRRYTSARTATLGTVGIGALLSVVGAITMWRGSMGDPAPHAALAYILFACAFFMGGAFDSITDVAQNAHALRVQRLYGRSIISSFHGGWSLGAVTGGLMGSLAVSLGIPLGWHLLASALIFMVVGALALHYSLPGADEDRSQDHGSDAGEISRVRTIPMSAIFVVALLTILAISGTLVEDAGSTWSVLYMRDYLGTAPGIAGLAYVTLLFAQAIGRLTADRITDALGARTTVQIGGALVMIGMGVAVLWPSVPTTVMGMVMAGLGCASIVPLAMNAADDIPGMRPGAGLTIVTWLMRLAFLLAPPLVGLLVQATSLRSAMAVMPVAGALTLVTSLVLVGRARNRERVS